MGNKIPPLYGENKDKYLKLAIENIEKAMDILEGMINNGWF